MNKKVIFGILIVFFLVATFSIGKVAAYNFENMTESERVDIAYDCLAQVVGNKTCDKLTTFEKIFSVLSVGECKAELKGDAKSDECWPKSRCDIKTTAQAILALDKVGEDTVKAEAWLLDQKAVPTDLIWYLEIEAQNATSCTITYDNNEYTTDILENKKITAAPGRCFSISETGYWLKIKPECYELDFEVKCGKSFLTTLLFKEQDSTTIHVLDEIHSAPEQGTTIETIESFCFADLAGTCDYEGTLWATAVLDKLDHELSSYVPYLVTGEPSNRGVFPQSLLYILTGYEEYKTNILSRQINEQYWKVSNGKYYDTALAMIPFRGRELTEGANAIEWLFEMQQEEGCWDGGNIVNNGFILYSLWPRGSYFGPVDIVDGEDNESGASTSDNDCEASNFFCMSGIECEGDLLSGYQGCGFKKCCNTAPAVEKCADVSGILCSGGEYCSGGVEKYTDDSIAGNLCCVGGTCEETTTPEPGPSPDEASCSVNDGTCEAFDCGDGYKETTMYSCASGSDTCCIVDGSSSTPKSKWWIWVLFILIILITIGIIYREKIREFIEDMQDKDKDDKSEPTDFVRPNRPGYPGPPGMRRPGAPHHRPGMPPQVRPMPSRPTGPSGATKQSRPMPPKGRPMVPQGNPSQRPQSKSPQELDSVLNKLKEMSK
ncbi:MAG: proline-rich domain-containing protein [Nanoarchaeota archaeon]|jgi:hypothetical protein|nr:proline-rich domain-containing protein [Nanoarchaeota archaeon]